MTKKTIALFTAVLLLAGLSFYMNRDRFRSDPLRITDRSRAPRGWMSRIKSPSNPVLFMLNRDTRLTSIEVLSVDDIQTNKFPMRYWRLTSDSNSAPVKEFFYGFNIAGMKPVVAGAMPEPLLPGQKYRILIEAAGQKAEHDFTPVPRTGR